MKGLTLSVLVMLVAAQAWSAPRYEYEIVGKQPHSRRHFVQGLEIRGDHLYQGTGLWGQSGVQVFELASGELIQQRSLPRRLFGEGITVFEDQVIQLTWRSGQAFVYNRADLSTHTEFTIPGEGWGLTNDGERLIYSDGSATLRFITPGSWQHSGSLEVSHNGSPLKGLNELEWTPEYLLANVWGEEIIYLIDMKNGQVIGEIDLTGILPASERRPRTDVMNGIAMDAETGLLWVTGKNWPWIYQIKLGRLQQKQ